jgi:hypothetical protein
MIERLGAAQQKDPRWLGYWASFRLDRFSDLSRTSGDMQLLEPRWHLGRCAGKLMRTIQQVPWRIASCTEG